jgi:hypothetical protein
MELCLSEQLETFIVSDHENAEDVLPRMGIWLIRRLPDAFKDAPVSPLSGSVRRPLSEASILRAAVSNACLPAPGERIESLSPKLRSLAVGQFDGCDAVHPSRTPDGKRLSAR